MTKRSQVPMHQFTFSEVNEHSHKSSHKTDEQELDDQTQLCQKRATTIDSQCQGDDQQQNRLRQKYQNRVEQWRQLKRDPQCRRFTAVLSREFTQLLLSLMSLDSGLVARDQGQKESLLSGAANVISLFPFTGSGFIKTLVQNAISYYEGKKQSEQVSYAVEGLTSLDKIDEIAGGLAMKLTRSYLEQLQALVSPEEAEKLAQSALARVVDYIFSRDASNDHNQYKLQQQGDHLNNELYQAVVKAPEGSNFYLQQVNQYVPDKIRQFYDQPIALKEKLANHLVDSDIYACEMLYRPGIKTAQRHPVHFESDRTKTEVYGFRFASRAEANHLGMSSIGQQRPETVIPSVKYIKVENPSEYDNQPSEQQQSERIERLEDDVDRLRQQQYYFQQLLDQYGFHSQRHQAENEQRQRRATDCCSLM